MRTHTRVYMVRSHMAAFTVWCTAETGVAVVAAAVEVTWRSSNTHTHIYVYIGARKEEE